MRATVRPQPRTDDSRPTALLTIDFEDYRRQQLRDHLKRDEPPHPAEVERQLDVLLELTDDIDAEATFFAVGRLTKELNRAVWRRILQRHQIGCHGYEHLHVIQQGPLEFRRDLHAAVTALEDVAGASVVSYRAPYFSADGCDPWFGEALAAEGLLIDSSHRMPNPKHEFFGTVPLPGAGGQVTSVPLPSIGFGPKRLTVIGGTYFRLLPLLAIKRLLARAAHAGFIPMIYLHPYDVDPTAESLDYEGRGTWKQRLGTWVRERGRRTAPDKLRELSKLYRFQSIESAIESRSVPADAARRAA